MIAPETFTLVLAVIVESTLASPPPAMVTLKASAEKFSLSLRRARALKTPAASKLPVRLTVVVVLTVFSTRAA